MPRWWRYNFGSARLAYRPITARLFHYWLASDANNYNNEHVGFYLSGNANHTGVSRDTSTDTRSVSAVAANTYRVYSFARIGTTSVRHFVNGTQVGSDLTDGIYVPNDNLPVRVRNAAGPGTTMTYDWVRVRPYRAIEPTLSLAGREQYTPIARYHLNETTWSGAAGEVVDSASGLNGRAIGTVRLIRHPSLQAVPGHVVRKFRRHR